MPRRTLPPGIPLNLTEQLDGLRELDYQRHVENNIISQVNELRQDNAHACMCTSVLVLINLVLLSLAACCTRW